MCVHCCCCLYCSQRLHLRFVFLSAYFTSQVASEREERCRLALFPRVLSLLSTLSLACSVFRILSFLVWECDHDMTMRRGAKRNYEHCEEQPDGGDHAFGPELVLLRRVRARLLQPELQSQASYAACIDAMAAFAEREFFLSDIDVPYFSHSEFAAVLQNDMPHLLGMDASLGGGPTVRFRTRRQWALIRRKMCDVFPAGCARPRRLSTNFLESERRELQTYRNDVRAVLRNQSLKIDARDARSGASLGKLWWQRYPFDLPTSTFAGAPVFIDLRLANIDLESGANVSPREEAPESISVNHDSPSVPSTNARDESVRCPHSTPERRDIRGQSSSVGQHGIMRKKRRKENKNRTKRHPYAIADNAIASRFVEGKFVALASSGFVTVRIGEDFVTVSDLNVMSVFAEQSASGVEPFSGYTASESDPSQFSSPIDSRRSAANRPEQASLITQIPQQATALHDHASRTLDGSPATHHGAGAASISGNVAGSLSAKRAYASPARSESPHLPPQIPQSLTPSPRKAFSFKALTGSNVEYEVHIRALAESLRLLDRKESLLSELQLQNNLAAAARAQGAIIAPDVRKKHAAVMEALAHANARLDVVLPGLRAGTSADPAVGPDFSSLFASIPRNSQKRTILHREPGQLLDFGPSPPPQQQLPRLDDPPREHVHDARPSSSTPMSARSPVVPTVAREALTPFRQPHILSKFAAAESPEGALGARRSRVDSHHLHRTPALTSAAGGAGAISTGSKSGVPDVHTPRPAASSSSPTRLVVKDTRIASPPPERLAKNVDFRSAAGAAILSKALARQALGNLPEDSHLKSAPAALRADVIECVSTCIALIIRAKFTRDSDAIHEILDALRVKCPENETLINIVKSAVREFDTTSSESQ